MLRVFREPIENLLNFFIVLFSILVELRSVTADYTLAISNTQFQPLGDDGVLVDLPPKLCVISALLLECIS